MYNRYQIRCGTMEHTREFRATRAVKRRREKRSYTSHKSPKRHTTARRHDCRKHASQMSLLYNRQWCFAKENTNETFKAVKIEVWLRQRLCHKQLIKKNKQTHYHQYQESSVFKAKLDENKQTKTTNKQKHTHTQNRSTFGKVQFIRRISQKNG